jgi:hypothetical protein
MNESAAAAAVAYIAKRESLENTSHYMPVLFFVYRSASGGI